MSYKIYKISLIYLMMINSVYAATVIVDNRTVDNKQTSFLNISIDPEASEIAGVQMNIIFDPSIVFVNGIIERDFLKKGGHSTIYNEGVIDNSMGLISNNYDVILGKYNVTNPGIYVSINFTAIGVGNTSIHLSNVLISGPNESVPYQVSNGSINVRNMTSIVTFPGMIDSPTDPDRDGIYEDINGNTRADFDDVVVFFNYLEWVAGNEPISNFDFNRNGRIDFNDIIKLFEML